MNQNDATARHAHMVDDPQRTEPLKRAIARAVQPGDTVCDIGTGTGVLAIAAAQAGAKEVFAIDCDADALGTARTLADDEGVTDRITFIEGLSFDVKLPQRVDCILCETVGSYAFDENILATLSDAKRRLLRKHGAIVPATLELWGAPITTLPENDNPAEIGDIDEADLLCPPERLLSVEFAGHIPTTAHAQHHFWCRRGGRIRAVAVWPRVIWWGDAITDASPSCPPTHWKQGICEIEERRVYADERVGFEFIVEPHPDDPRKMTERLWRWI